jgi:N-methylhydantoinase A
MLLADLRHDYVRSYGRLWSELDPEAVLASFVEMGRSGTEALDAEGVADELRAVHVAADLRYVGQHHEVIVPFERDELTAPGGLERIVDAFERRHEELYGFSSPGRALEVINLRVIAYGRRQPPFELAVPASDPGPLPVRGRRRAYLTPSRALEELEVLDGDRMMPGHRAHGPVIVDEATTTVVVPEDFDLLVDATGSFVLQRKGAEVAG